MTTSPQKPLEQYYPGLAAACLRVYRRTIDAIRTKASLYGYAITVHGSLARDIDLVAVPWRDSVGEPFDLVWGVLDAIHMCGYQSAFIDRHDLKNGGVIKPHGRRCWSIHVGNGPYFDFSVLPTLPGNEVAV